MAIAVRADEQGMPCGPPSDESGGGIRAEQTSATQIEVRSRSEQSMEEWEKVSEERLASKATEHD